MSHFQCSKILISYNNTNINEMIMICNIVPKVYLLNVHFKKKKGLIVFHKKVVKIRMAVSHSYQPWLAKANYFYLTWCALDLRTASVYSSQNVRRFLISHMCFKRWHLKKLCHKFGALFRIPESRLVTVIYCCPFPFSCSALAMTFLT